MTVPALRENSLREKQMTEIKSLTIDELKAALKEMGEKPFRAGQIFKWLHEGVSYR